MSIDPKAVPLTDDVRIKVRPTLVDFPLRGTLVSTLTQECLDQIRVIVAEEIAKALKEPR